MNTCQNDIKILFFACVFVYFIVPQRMLLFHSISSNNNSENNNNSNNNNITNNVDFCVTASNIFLHGTCISAVKQEIIFRVMHVKPNQSFFL